MLTAPLPSHRRSVFHDATRSNRRECGRSRVRRTLRWPPIFFFSHFPLLGHRKTNAEIRAPLSQHLSARGKSILFGARTALVSACIRCTPNTMQRNSIDSVTNSCGPHANRVRALRFHDENRAATQLFGMFCSTPRFHDRQIGFSARQKARPCQPKMAKWHREMQNATTNVGHHAKNSMRKC